MRARMDPASPPVIRIAVEADRPAVEAIVAAAYAPFIQRIGRALGPMLDDYAALIGAGHVRVAEHAGVVRGVLVLIPEPDVLLLDNVAVAPAAQGLGVGGALLRFAEAAARDAGYRRIRLYTHEAMIENIALYARYGYVEARRGEERGFRRVFMAKALQAS